jgi:hypothetical protein
MEQYSAGVLSKPSSPRASGLQAHVTGPAVRHSDCGPFLQGLAVRRSGWKVPEAVGRIRPLFLFFLPPSYTHRNYVGVGRGRGGPGAVGRVPPPRFVWEIPKIDCRHTNPTRSTHHELELAHAWEIW